MKEHFNINKYSYQLPEERIAKHPLANRDDAKLLVWRDGQISHHYFRSAPDLIPEQSLLVFNDTKVIAARLLFQKSTGANIEIFLLHPEMPTRDIQESMTLKSSATWQCLVGNKKKWKDGILERKIGDCLLTATYHDQEKNLIQFSWTGDITFSEIVNQAGVTPLPPYMKRKPIDEDSERYQTIYSKNDGAVAAPTAGLHFTNEILNKLKSRNIDLDYLTLHVSAGTFKPVKKDDFREHDMHCEQVIVSKKSLVKLLENYGRIIAVGTTSLRILESLYWFGNKLKENPEADFKVEKNLPYIMKSTLSYQETLQNILAYCERNGIEELHGETEIFIYPGYNIQSISGLFTNFHLPKSTLLLLISSFVRGQWKEIYDEALENDYRFLSYGDSSLLLR